MRERTTQKSCITRKITRFAIVCFFLGICLRASFGRDTPSLWRNVFGEFVYLSRLSRVCGELCRVHAGNFSDGIYFRQRSLDVDCRAIFSDSVFITRGHGRVEPPRDIPDSLLADFTLNGEIPVTRRYFNQKYLASNAEVSTWTHELVSSWTKLAGKGRLKGNYGTAETNHLRNALKHARGIRGGRVLVIGSENPWVEACVLEAGASSIVTLEYGKITSLHPSIATMTPSVFKKSYLRGSLGRFDAIVTFSSVEHSGLGRYGDALNPWGDVLEIARAHCVCKPGGSLVVAVMYGSDELQYNAHRVYGELRWPYLASNWLQVHRESTGEQRVHVFVK